MNKDLNVENIINMNYRVLTLLGIATSIINQHVINQPNICDWFMQAITDVVYNNKPIPPMPERELL